MLILFSNITFVIESVKLFVELMMLIVFNLSFLTFLILKNIIIIINIIDLMFTPSKGTYLGKSIFKYNTVKNIIR